MTSLNRSGCTAIMRGLIEELMPAAADPGKFLGEINRSLSAILRRTREPFLATAFYMVADVSNPELRYASAGHPSPFRVQRAAEKAQALKSSDPRHGPALGLFERPAYPTCLCDMAPGDLFLLFTDGIYEVDGPDAEEYGQERLLGSVRRHLRLPTEHLLGVLIQEVREFAGTRDFEDDVCLVAMQAGQNPS